VPLVGEQTLGVPLDSKGEGGAGPLDRLNDAVLSTRHHGKARRDLVDGLVVGAVDAEGSLPDDARESRIRRDGDLVHDLGGPLALLVGGGRVKMLNERSTSSCGDAP